MKCIHAATCPDVKIIVIKELLQVFCFVLLLCKLNNDMELPTVLLSFLSTSKCSALWKEWL